MLTINKKHLVIISCLIAAFLLPGCTNWKYKYEYLQVDHQNLKGRYDKASHDREQLSSRVAQDQRTIEELTRRIEELNQSPSQATGFEGLDVAFDASAGTITVTLPNSILFSSGKATLKNTTTRELDQIISVLKSQYSGRRVDVVGHTDTDPIKKSGWKDNWELSTERALSVVRYMTKRGIGNDKIQASGCGSARPVASNSSSSGKSKNRRVEVVVHMR